MYDVPFVSQFNNITDPDWRWRGCGMVALKMVMDYWHRGDASCKTLPMDELLQAGLGIGAYMEGIGWRHRGLVELAKNFGYDGYNVDNADKGPNPKTPDESWAELDKELQKGPVLASVYHGLDPERGGGHIVVVTGFQDGLLAFNDPEEQNPFEGKRFIELSHFIRGFKRRFIVIRPK